MKSSLCWLQQCDSALADISTEYRLDVDDRRPIQRFEILAERRPMNAYVITTGTVFGLLALAHRWRIIEEGPALAKNPWYVLITAAAAAVCFWAWRLLRLSKRPEA